MILVSKEELEVAPLLKMKDTEISFWESYIQNFVESYQNMCEYWLIMIISSLPHKKWKLRDF